MIKLNRFIRVHRGILVVATILLLIGLLFVPAEIVVKRMETSPASITQQQYRTFKPQISTGVIINPGKGWVLYGMPSDHTASTMAYASVGYMRYDWSSIEPAEGVYNWSAIDNALNAWKAHGKQFAFGVMNANSSDWDIPYITPQWVFADGAAYILSHTFDNVSGKTGIEYVPVWSDPIFQQKVKGFLTALAQRYDNNPSIAYIDVRSYGNWGEQHVYGIPPSVAASSTDVQNYIQMYKDVFKRTQLMVPWGMSNYDSVYDWAVANGVGIRRDGLMVDSNGSELTRAYGRTPSVFEFYASYQWLVQNGYWSDAKLISDVGIGKPSYIGMGQWDNDADIMLTKEQPLIASLANQMGYYFVVTNATLPTTISNNQPVNISLSWSNQGVNYLYKSCEVAVALLDSSNNVIQRQWIAGSNPDTWAPGQTTQQNFSVTFTNLPGGTYKLAVGLFQNTSDSNPTYRIGNQGRTANGWYVLASKVNLPSHVMRI